MDALVGAYDDEGEGSQSSSAAAQRPRASSTALAVLAAPEVGSLAAAGVSTPMISTDAKVVAYNPKYEALWAPEQGPKNPYFVDGVTPGMRNHLGGGIERTHIADFHFEDQYQTFNTVGYAMDPAAASDATMGSDVVGDRATWASMQGRTVQQMTKRDAKKRKVEDPAAAKVLEGRGTALTEEEEAQVAADLAAAEEKEAKEREEIKEERKRREIGVPEATSQLHIKENVDYQGRTWLECPSDLKAQSELASTQSYIPKTCVHTWTGHTAGVHAIRWFPKSGHLLLSASMDNKVKIWDVYNNRKCVRTYNGHTKPVRGIDFSPDGRQFVSCGYDRLVRYWDTETGTCLKAWKAKGIPYCVKIHPGDDNILAGCSDKNIVQWDPRQGTDDSHVQDYVQHLGAVNTVNFIDQSRRVVSTGDDKKLFVWEYGIGTAPMKHVSEPWMHSMPSMTCAPLDDGDPKYMLGQSMDNQILVYQCGDRFKLNKKKHFVGHTVAGTACQIGASPDMKYVISGDGDGRLWLWDWRSTKVYRKIKAHDGVCIGAIWHPIEPSKVATCGWDGLIKFWD